ncbi:hypothetical protein SADUNF_Sadunf10G0103900 [Salix dunnii]|uniref:Prolyl endopeptidase-like n=1 Tax=Salix dunnii TaxID=1413687 RepID=A0A835MQQ4_9ROSI|nr:hypothetical protein SADUNF_Sadunf10G0103900 [Salix dunnii]
MEDLWKRAKVFAEEAAKKSQTLTTSSNKISDLVAETAKKSKQLAFEASKKADEFKVAALKQADQIQFKSISDIIPPHLSSLSILRKFGVTDDLRDLVKGLTSSTFQNFPFEGNPHLLQYEVEPSDVETTESNVRKDLSEWQEKHATLVLTTVKQISKLRYELCPRVMKERRFWRIYFVLVSTHVGPYVQIIMPIRGDHGTHKIKQQRSYFTVFAFCGYEKQYMEEVKRKEEEQIQEEKAKESSVTGENSSKSEPTPKNLKTETSSVEQDLDSFLLGDLEDSDGGPDDGAGSFDDDFDKIDNSDIEDEKHLKDYGERLEKKQSSCKEWKRTESPDSMALLSLLVSKPSLKTSLLSLTSHLIPIIPSFPLSSHCTTSTFPLPSQSPPVPKKLPFNISAHAKTWQDPYHWMRNAKDPDFVDYLNQENSYAQAFMADTQNLQRILLEEMKNRLPAQISTPPERWGHWLYYQYIPEGKEYPVLCRRLETEESGLLKTLLNYAKGHFGMEQVLLDWNQIAEQYGKELLHFIISLITVDMSTIAGYVHVGTCRVSPDHNFLAYTVDITGNEQFLLQVKDLSNGDNVSRSQVDGVVSLAWAQDSTILFYTVSDENQRPYRQIVYVIDATNPLGGLQRVRERVSGVRYFLEHHYGVFYILTNAPLSESEDRSDGNYYLAQCQVEDIQSSDWQNIILPSEDMSFQDMDIFNGHLVLFVNKKSFPALCSVNLPIKFNSVKQLEIENLDPWFFPLPSNQCNIVPGSNHDFMNPVYRVVLSSPVMPGVIVDYNMSERIFSIVQQEKVRDISGDCGSCSLAYELDTSEHRDPLNNKEKNSLNIELQRWKDFSGAYCCKTKEVISHDGVRVPLTILYSQKAWQSGHSPGLLEGYGAYGEVLDKSWCSDRLSLLDRGWVLAFADVRGGGGGGHSLWHKHGSGLNKCNSIHDFISCGNYLVSEGYVHRDRLGAIGFSAGGLLVGAAINMNPNLFRAAILKVPFLDTCNTLLDPSLPLTLLDHEEFGNPQIQSQVGVWEAAKWVARTRDIACSHCSRSVILKTNLTGGHFGEGGCYSQCEETAYDYAFLMKTMGNSFQHSFSHLADDWSIHKIGGLAWDAFSFIMKADHAYRGKWETSKKVPGQHRKDDCVCHKQ